MSDMLEKELKVWNEGSGGSLGVLDEEGESTEDSGREDHIVATDDNVDDSDATDIFLALTE